LQDTYIHLPFSQINSHAASTPNPSSNYKLSNTNARYHHHLKCHHCILEHLHAHPPIHLQHPSPPLLRTLHFPQSSPTSSPLPIEIQLAALRADLLVSLEHQKPFVNTCNKYLEKRRKQLACVEENVEDVAAEWKKWVGKYERMVYPPCITWRPTRAMSRLFQAWRRRGWKKVSSYMKKRPYASKGQSQSPYLPRFVITFTTQTRTSHSLITLQPTSQLAPQYHCNTRTMQARPTREHLQADTGQTTECSPNFGLEFESLEQYEVVVWSRR
jgi:hypothetical protein